MTDSELISLLWKYGHFRNPENDGSASFGVNETDLAALTVDDAAVKEAVQSYQRFQRPVLDGLSAMHHGRRSIADGSVGPATRDLLELPRCDVPDFVLSDEAIGSGRWGQCALDQFPSNNAVRVHWDTSRIPAFLSPVFDNEVWPNVVAHYGEIGMGLVRVENKPDANIACRFTVPQQESGNLRGNWIGLAIVGWSGIKCSEQIWALFDLNYRPANVVREWTTLVDHEIGHNMGLNHSSGGIMNPSIIRGLNGWVGDPSESILNQWFGGNPVEKPTPEPGPGPTPPGTGYYPDLLVVDESTGDKYRLFKQASV